MAAAYYAGTIIRKQLNERHSMDGAIIIIAIIAVAALYFYVVKKTTDTSRSNEAIRRAFEDTESEWEKELRAAQQRLSAALASCQKDHPQAADALCWLAGSDGTVSKQELRILFRFCAEQGTQIDKAAYKDIDNLNAGMSVKVRTTERDAHQSIKALAEKPAAYRLAFYGAANKICGSQKRLSETKQRFIKAAEAIIQ